MSERLISMANGPGGGDGLEEIETGVATRTRPKTKRTHSRRRIKRSLDL
jgi:hypothetical protein